MIDMPTYKCHHIGMSMNSKKTQYTIRNVPRSVDHALRKKAQQERKSLNSILLEAVVKEAGISGEPKIHHDLDHLIGSWVHDKAVDQAFSEQREVNPKDWE